MNYLFTQKKISLGDVCKVICNKDQLKLLHFDRYFPTTYSTVQGISMIGIKVTQISDTYCKGYMVYYNKTSKKVCPNLNKGEKIYFYINQSNIIGILKYEHQ